MPICILCTSVRNSFEKPEHILLNALGGKKTVYGIICDDCNNVTGSTIDRHLTHSIESIRAHAGFKAGDGDAPPKLRNLGGRAVKYDLVDGIPRFRPQQAMERELNDDGSHTISIQARDLPHLLQLVEQAITRWKLTDEIAEKFRAEFLERSVVHHHPTPTVEFNLSLGDRMSLRSMAKSMLVLLASQIGNDSLLHRSFDGVRHFIMNDADTIDVSINSNRLPSFTEAHGPTPSVIWVGQDLDGAVFGYFNLYGVVGWTFKLSDHLPSKIRPIMLINDPRQRENRTTDPEAAELLPVERVKESAFSEQDIARGITTLHSQMHEYSRERLIEKSLSDELSKTNFDETGYVDPTETQRVLEGLAYRVVMGLFRVPWSEPVQGSVKDLRDREFD
ncbi:HNH endonuclease [Rhizobium sp. AG855]|uniref:HNH endonuclease n=1 Tax=Rhizobium sp. AG855 TaxID=2183898 RepID=UPI000E70C0DE|nr:HNH endonuclease [Rhizobium sp. AG855]RKE85047.1 HNH endonuclease [Rhizobium sp. AG855]